MANRTYWETLSKAILQKSKYSLVENLRKLKKISDEKDYKREEREYTKARDKILLLKDKHKMQELHYKRLIAKSRRVAINRKMMSSTLKRPTLK